jgi:hypothetical protein
MKNMRVYLFCVVCIGLISGYTAYAQPEQRERYEKERKMFDEDFTVIPLKQDGIALYRDLRDYENRDRIREIVLLDTLLQEKAVLTARVETRSLFKGYEHSPGELHILFSKNETRGELEIVSVDLASKTLAHHTITAEIKFQLTHFIKVARSFVLAGYYDSEPVILIYNIAERKLKLIPGLFQKNTELLDVRGNQNGTFNVVMVDREIRDAQNIIFRTFDSFGVQLIEDLIPTQGNLLQSGISSSLEREDLVVLGSWGARNSKQALGFYATQINPFGKKEIKYYYFGQLTHYLDHLKPKRATNIQEKTKQALAVGKTPDYTNYVMPYKIIEHRHGFMLLAETYIPSSRTNQYPMNNNPYGYNNPYYYNQYGGYYPYNRMYNPNDPRMYGNNVVSEDDIKTVQSIVISFDAAGNIKSDYCVKFDEVKSAGISQVADFQLTHDSIYFVYKKESELKVKSINLANGESKEYAQPIKLKDPADLKRSEEKSGEVRQWYRNNFYVWGHQTVRNAGKNRDVFYINRVTIQ